jgi:hypothetical protein
MEQQKAGLKKQTVIAGLIISVWLCITLVILGAFNIKDGWPAFLTLLFFFETGARTENLKNIFVGAAAGLILAWALTPLVTILVPAFGLQGGILVGVFIIVFLLIGLGDVSPTFHLFFNNYAFCYFTVALIYHEQATLQWLAVLFLAGLFFTGGILLIIKLMTGHKHDQVADKAV